MKKKIKELREVFPEKCTDDIMVALVECDGSTERAVEYLLNIQQGNPNFPVDLESMELNQKEEIIEKNE